MLIVCVKYFEFTPDVCGQKKNVIVWGKKKKKKITNNFRGPKYWKCIGNFNFIPRYSILCVEVFRVENYPGLGHPRTIASESKYI